MKHDLLDRNHFPNKKKPFPDDALLDFAKEFVQNRLQTLLKKYFSQPKFQSITNGKDYQLFRLGPIKLEKRIHDKMKALILGPHECNDRFQAANSILDYVRGCITLPNPSELINIYEDFMNGHVTGFKVVKVDNLFRPDKISIHGMPGHRCLLLHCLMDLGHVCSGAHGRPPNPTVTLVKTDRFIVEIALNLEHYLQCYKRTSKAYYIERMGKLSKFAQ